MIALPKLLTRTSYLMGAGVLAIVPIVMAWALLTQPQHRLATLTLGPLMELILIGMLLKSMALDAQNGRIVTTWAGVFKRVVELREVTHVGVGGNGAGAGLLGVKSPSRQALVPVLHLTDMVQKSRDVAQLSSLADAIDRFVPAAAAHRAETIDLLRQQAAWTGDPKDSPIAPRVSDKWIKAGQASSVLSVFSFLD